MDRQTADNINTNTLSIGRVVIGSKLEEQGRGGGEQTPLTQFFQVVSSETVLYNVKYNYFTSCSLLLLLKLIKNCQLTSFPPS